MFMTRQSKRFKNLTIEEYKSVIRWCILVFVILVILPSFSLADTTVGGTISTDTTWTASGSPYIVTSSITISGVDGADGITTLTIEPGVEIRFSSYTQLIVGALSGNPGALIAQGTGTDPIVFTSNQASPAAGDWYGIKFYNTTDDATTSLAYCNVQYAGLGNQGQVYIRDSAPALSHCAFSGSSNYDLYYYGTVVSAVA
jgi:hypothetical protein